MRYVTALFDAPIPARAAAAALASAGFHPDDIALVPHLAGAPATGWFVDADPADARGVRQALEDLGFDTADAARAAEGARRGAIILMVRTPTLSAPVAAEVIAALAPPDPDDLAAAWEADPGLTYAWAAVPAPSGTAGEGPAAGGDAPRGDDGIPVVDEGVPAADDHSSTAAGDVPVAAGDVPIVDDDVPMMDSDVPTANDDVPATADDVPTANDDVPATADAVPAIETSPGHGPDTPDAADPELRRPGS